MKRSGQLFVIALVSLTIGSASSRAATTHGPQRIEHVPAGTEWIAGHGLSFPSSARQVASKTFAQRYGAQWSERRHGPARAFRTLWGAGIPVPAEAMRDAASAQAIAEAFLADNPDLFPAGVSAADLEPWSNELVRGIRLVSFQQRHAGLPVLGASAFVAMKHGRLVMAAVRCLPVAAPKIEVATGATQAALLARAQLAERGVEAEAAAPALVLFPRLVGESVRLESVFAVELRAPGQGRWTAYLDADSGVLVALRDERLFLGAHVQLEHHDRHPPAGLVQSPAAYLQVSTGAGSLYTDADGHFDAEGGVDLEIRGRYARVINLDGDDLSARLDQLTEGLSFTWRSDGSEEQQAQLDAYRFVTDARDHARALSPELAWLDRLLRVNVNYDDVCNAWFDGDLTFLRAGSYAGIECHNAAMIADIVYHEFGHGYHMSSAVSGVAGIDDSVSEGFADYFAASITGDPLIAPAFEIHGSALRDLRVDRAWPDDAGYDPHETGLIVGGALWDLRLQLQEELGADAGADAANAIFAGMVTLASDVPSTYEAALLADDDNGNLADGTPHSCAIDAAFGIHGLKTDALQPLVIAHTPLTRLAPERAVTLEVEVSETSTACVNALVGNARLVYSVDGGESWQTQSLARGDGERFTGELPPLPAGTSLRYRLEVDEPLSETVVSRPVNQAEPYFQAFVGELEELAFDDLETAAEGWSHRLIAGSAGEGADDWQRGTPGGAGGDPDRAHSGSFAWGNDLGMASDWNGQYQANKRNALTSPVWEVGDHEQVRLQFWRWLGVEDGRYDAARVYVNEQMVWHNALGEGALHHVDREWVLVDLDISAQVAGEGTAQVTWELESDGGMELGGWTIDDVGIYAVVEPGGGSEPPVVSASGDGEGDGSGTPGRLIGCGCAQSTAGDGAALLSLLVLGLLVRRRKG